MPWIITPEIPNTTHPNHAQTLHATAIYADQLGWLTGGLSGAAVLGQSHGPCLVERRTTQEHSFGRAGGQWCVEHSCDVPGRCGGNATPSATNGAVND